MKVFKTSLGGFKKSDVNNFIIEMNREFTELKSKYEEEISSLKNENADLSAGLDKAAEKSAMLNEAEAKITDLTESLEMSQKRENELQETITEYSTELAKERSNAEACLSKCAEYKQKTEELASLIASLNEQISTASADTESRVRALQGENCELKRKIEESEENLAAEVSRRVRAKENAANARLGEKARAAGTELESATDTAVARINNAFFESADSCLKDFKDYADKLLYNSKTIISDIAKEYTEMAERAAYYCDSLEKSAKRSIEDYKSKTDSIREKLTRNK